MADNFVGEVPELDGIGDFELAGFKLSLPSGHELSRHSKKIKVSDAAVKYLGYTEDQTDTATVRQMLYALSKHDFDNEDVEVDEEYSHTDADTDPTGDDDIPSQEAGSSSTENPTTDTVSNPKDELSNITGTTQDNPNSSDGPEEERSDPINGDLETLTDSPILESGSGSIPSGMKVKIRGKGTVSPASDDLTVKDSSTVVAPTLGDDIRYKYPNTCKFLEAVDDAMEGGLFITPSALASKVRAVLKVMEDCRHHGENEVRMICISPMSAMAKRFHTVLRREVNMHFCFGPSLRVNRLMYIAKVMDTLKRFHANDPNSVMEIINETCN
jgi:hypothetical protein